MSVLRSFVLAAVISAGFAGAAQARDPVFTIKIDAPVAEQTRVIANNAVWTCDGDTCLARPAHEATVRACRAFVRESGVRVVEYGSEVDQLSADELARCNGDAAATVQAQAR
jgi:hypothetical protein